MTRGVGSVHSRSFTSERARGCVRFIGGTVRRSAALTLRASATYILIIVARRGCP